MYRFKHVRSIQNTQANTVVVTVVVVVSVIVVVFSTVTTFTVLPCPFGTKMGVMGGTSVSGSMVTVS